MGERGLSADGRRRGLYPACGVAATVLPGMRTARKSGFDIPGAGD
jgi:hypothetical protein